MKTALHLITLLFLVTVFASCEECMTCNYTYEQYHAGNWDRISEIEEYCGSKSELEDYEADFMENAKNSERKDMTTPVCVYEK